VRSPAGRKGGTQAETGEELREGKSSWRRKLSKKIGSNYNLREILLFELLSLIKIHA
jgi:hypothetical protein